MLLAFAATSAGSGNLPRCAERVTEQAYNVNIAARQESLICPSIR